MSAGTIALRHGRIDLRLHVLKQGEGPKLLLLHGLGESYPSAAPSQSEGWPGSVYGLDFTGHGGSTLPRGGGYTAEVLMGDADAAIGELGEATVCGRGLGAYVALLLAGAHPEPVAGAILCDGPGLAGGGSQPLTPILPFVDPAEAGPPDPFALSELARDLRPPDYATAFARQTTQLSGRERAITVCARQRPDWLAAVASEPGVAESDLDEALAHYASTNRESHEG